MRNVYGFGCALLNDMLDLAIDLLALAQFTVVDLLYSIYFLLSVTMQSCRSSDL